MGNTVGTRQQNHFPVSLPCRHFEQAVQTVGGHLCFRLHPVVVIILCVDHFAGTVTVRKGQPFRQGAAVSAAEFGTCKPAQMIFPVVLFSGDDHHISPGGDFDLFGGLFHQRDGFFPAFSFGINKVEDPVIAFVVDGGVLEDRQVLFLHPEGFLFRDLHIGFRACPEFMINLIGASAVHVIRNQFHPVLAGYPGTFHHELMVACFHIFQFQYPGGNGSFKIFHAFFQVDGQTDIEPVAVIIQTPFGLVPV